MAYGPVWGVLRPGLIYALNASCSCHAVWPACSWTDSCLIVVQYCAGRPVPEQDGRLVVSSRAKRLKAVLSFSEYVCPKKRYLLPWTGPQKSRSMNFIDLIIYG
jgi:hypothetical protein